jgi:hypothetical protein
MVKGKISVAEICQTEFKKTSAILEPHRPGDVERAARLSGQLSTREYVGLRRSTLASPETSDRLFSFATQPSRKFWIAILATANRLMQRFAYPTREDPGKQKNAR